MELFEINAQIKARKLQPLYVFTGEEVAIMDIYMKQIATARGAAIKRVDTVSSIFGKVQNKTFVSKPTCYIIRDDKDYLSQENVWSGLENGTIQGDNIIILVYTNLDKRGRFYKAHEKGLVVFDPLPTETLCKYIKRDLGLNEADGVTLSALCDNNYSRILLEGDKIKHLATANNIPIEAAFHKAVKEKLIYTTPKDVIFGLIDAICMRRASESFTLLNELNAYKDNTLAVISLLYTNIRSMLLVQSAGKCDNITERTGLTGWQVKCARDKGNHYEIYELVRALRTIRETEKGIKTGTIDQDMAVEYILVNVL